MARTEQAQSSTMDNGTAIDLLNAAAKTLAAVFCNVHDEKLEASLTQAHCLVCKARERLEHNLQIVETQ